MGQFNVFSVLIKNNVKCIGGKSNTAQGIFVQESISFGDSISESLFSLKIASSF